jgi:hypothetical protein
LLYLIYTGEKIENLPSQNHYDFKTQS